MAAIALVVKDFREHRVAALFLMVGCIGVVLVLLAQNKAAAYSMSSFEIVRFALISFLPLITLIVGNRLIVNEYLSGTRLFVEALPVGQNLPLVLKYLTGFCYLSTVSVIMVLLAAQSAGFADDVTPHYLLLILGKTLVMVWLYWSIIFCFSLCGHLRLALYLVSAAIFALIAFYPGINSDLFPPFALMDDQLFVFERDVIPWYELAGTATLACGFTAAGFLLTKVGEGSVVERLAKPMTRRDYVALGVLAATGLAIWTTVLEQNQREPVEFSSTQVVRYTDPPVSVLFLDEEYRESAEALAQRTSESLIALQASLGLADIPDVKLALAPTREKHDIDYETADGVFITANWLEHDSYDDAILDSVLMHGVLSAQTTGRAMFEPYHWVLDGFTRWWVEQGQGPIDPDHRAELLARALWVLEAEPYAAELVSRWQLTADRFSYPSAEALAWSVMDFLEQTHGRAVVLALGIEFLTQPVSPSVAGTMTDRMTSVAQRIESATGIPSIELFEQWQSWLEQQRSIDSVQGMLIRIPPITGSIVSVTDKAGIHSLEASYMLNSGVELAENYFEELDGRCIMKHDYIGPFDTEFEVVDDYEDEVECQTGTTAHVIDSIYSPGDRVFIALDFEGRDFHQPLRVQATRLTIQ